MKTFNLDNLPSVEKVTRVYSGRPGCACGCRGNYHEGKSMSRVFKNLISFASSGQCESYLESGIEYKTSDGEKWISFESETKVYTVYYK